MPKVSVVIPIYGVEKYIERCARSLFEQSLDDIEFVFMDDCSPDKSVIILKRVIEEYTQRLQEKHHHIKIETMEKTVARQLFVIMLCNSVLANMLFIVIVMIG